MATEVNDPGEHWAVRHRMWLLAALGALLYLPTLHLRDLWYPDEPDIAEVALAMFRSGDWIAPRRMGVIWVDYPPLLYWAGCAFSHLLERMSEFTLRLPNALAGIAGVLYTCRVGTRWYGPRAGLWAGIALLTLFQFFYQAICYRPDMLFTVAIAIGMVLYYEGVAERPRATLRIAGFAMLGVAMLAKGPLGVLLPGLALVLWHASRRRWLRILELAALALVALAVYLPWFVACARAMGADSIVYELYAQNVARFLAGDRGHGQPIWYFVTNFWSDLAPWSFLVPPAIWWAVRTRRRQDPKVAFLLWWFGTFFVFLTLAVTKRQLYLLPVYPAIALLLAPWLARVGRAEAVGARDAPSSRAVRWYGAGMTLLLALLALLMIGVLPATGPLLERLTLNEQQLEVAHAIGVPLAVLGVMLAGTAVALGRAWRRGDVRAILRRTTVAFVVLYTVAFAIVVPEFQPTKTYKPQSEWIVARVGDEPALGMVDPAWGIRKRGAFGYYTGKMVELFETPAEVDAFLRAHPRSVVLVEEEVVERIFAGDRAGWERRVEHRLRTGSQLYLVVGPPGPFDVPRDEAPPA